MQSNVNFNRKFLLSCFIILISFCLILIFPGILKEISLYLSRHVPVIKNQLSRGTEIGNSAANYFSIIITLIPFLIIYVAAGENFYLRIKETAKRRHKNLGLSLLFLYLSGVPVCLFVLYAMYSASLSTSKPPYLFGEHIAFFMANSYAGLFIFGGLAGMGALIFSVIFIALIIAPFQALQQPPKNAKK
ncbi:hypothetical protein [Variovorax atrisoli]|uniref:hypothetical protein n=1 Tax=Variovorax atrisoli TaxID=3394203 RepID=UPI0033976BE0